MYFDSNKRFSLDSSYFDKMRSDLDTHIRRAFAIMDKKDISGAKIGLAIDITTDRDKVRDDKAPLGVREAVVPHVGYKLTFKLEAKGEVKGDVVGGGHEVVRDDSGDYYILTKDEASGQLSLFNGFAEVDNEFPDDDEEADE